MATLYADFNARTEDDCVRLSTRGSQESLQHNPVRPDSWVWLTDGELRVGAQIEERDGELLARPAWEMLEDILPPEERPTGKALQVTLLELEPLMRSNDFRGVLKRLPLVEHALEPGRADYARSRAAEAFGYPELALLAIEDALAKNPDRPGFVQQRLILLSKLDLDRAVLEAERFASDLMAPAGILVVCAQIIAADARRSEPERARDRHAFLLAFTDRFDAAPGRASTSPGAVASLHLLRGYALIDLNRKPDAIREFGLAKDASPDSAEPYAARGMETYPSNASVRDLERAVDSVRDLESAVALGIDTYWPAYYLAHFYLCTGDYARARERAEAALRFEPPNPIKANLIEWQVIAEVQMGGDLQRAQRRLREAIALAPELAHVQKNLEIVEGIAAVTPPKALPFKVERDAQGGARELVAVAA